MTTVATNFDERGRNKWKFPVARQVVTVTVAQSATTGSALANLNGEVIGFVYDVPALTGTAATATFDLLDEDGQTWHSKASLAEGAKTIEKLLPDATPYRFGVVGTQTYKFTCSTSQTTAAVDINVIVYLR